MELSMGSKIIALLLTHLILVNGQVSTPCTVSMVTSFTPCLNFITGSSNNGTLPIKSCCSKLKPLISTGVDCACLLLTGGVPLQLPINQTLALSLPAACKINGGVPLQCKPSGAPLPAPGPVLFGPSPPPAIDSSPFSPRGSVLFGPSPPPAIASSPFSPTASKVPAIAPTPQSKHNKQSTPVTSQAPTTIRPVLSSPVASSTSYTSYSASSHALIIVLTLGFMSY